MVSSATSGPRSSPLPIRRFSCPPGRPGRLADLDRHREAEAAAPPPRGPLVLTVDRLTKQFGGFTALNAVSFEVKAGEILGLIGPNGSGKTTCFNCISGALAATAGSIRFKGDEIAGLTPDAICHRGLARTFQIPRPFRKLSILENVAVAAHFRAGRRTHQADVRPRAPPTPGRPGAAPRRRRAGGPRRCWPWWACPPTRPRPRRSSARAVSRSS